MNLTVIEKTGWRKPVILDKTVIKVGSAAFCDVQLPSIEISPVHLQLIYDPENPACCKVVNLGPVVSYFSHKNETKLEPYAAQDVRDGDEIVLGEYRLHFDLPYSPELLVSSRRIAATLTPLDTILRPELPMTVVLRLKNLGNFPACTFQVTVSGIAESCYQVDPLPILYPAAEEEVRIQFFHRVMLPAAGAQTVNISVTAPDCYPGEQVLIRQGMYVTPVLRAELRVKDDMPVTEKAPLPEPVPAAAPPVPAVEPVQSPLPTPAAPPPVPPVFVDPVQPPLPAAVKVPEPTPAPEPPAPPARPVVEPRPAVRVITAPPEEEPLAAKPVTPAAPLPEPVMPVAPVTPKPPAPLDISRAKVVRGPAETFWEE